MDMNLLSKLEQEHGLQPGLLNAVMMQESGGRADAVSPKGARGWFQFMPQTAQAYGVQDPTDFTQSATGAAKYLGNLYKQFGNWEDALRAYNWGEGNLSKFKRGKRKDMPAEAQAYPQAVLARLGDAAPDLPEDDEEPPELPPDLPDDAPAAPAAEKARDYQAELEARSGTILYPTVGAVAGGIMGTVAGATGGAGIGAIPGAAIGGTGGAMVGHIAAIMQADVPVEEKLKYLIGKFNVEAISNLIGTKGANWFVNALAKTPAERIAIQQWMEKNGSNIHPITDRELSPRAAGVYRQAERDIANTIDVAIGKSLSELTAGGRPSQLGSVFQRAYQAADEALFQTHDGLFAPFRHGTPFGSLKVTPTPQLRTKAQEVMQNFKDVKMTEKEAGASASVLKIVDDLAKGKEVDLATLVAQKRALGRTSNWEAVNGSVDNGIRKNLTVLLDDAIEKRLAGVGPAAAQSWKTANATAARDLGIMNDKLITRLASSDKTDPMVVTEFVAKNASPATMTAYKKALGLMVQKGALTQEQNAYLMDHVRRNWIEQNMNTSSKAADIYESILGTGKNQEAVDAFNAVFNGSPYKTVLQETAKAAHALREFGARIPNAAGSVGEYTTAGVGGGMVGGKLGTTVATGGVYLMNAIPKLLAKAQLRNDSALRNKVRFVVNYVNQATPEQLKDFAKGSITMMPANVQRTYVELQSQLGDE